MPEQDSQTSFHERFPIFELLGRPRGNRIAVTAQAGDLGGGANRSSLASGSASNAAGVIEYCDKNNYLGGTPPPR